MNDQREPSDRGLGSLARIGIARAETTRVSQQRRQRIVLQLERLIDDVAQARQRRRRLRVASLAATAAAVAAAGIALVKDPSKEATVASRSTTRSATARLVAATGRISVRPPSGASGAGRLGQVLEARDELSVEPAGTARLVLSNGAQVQLDGDSRLRIAPDGRPNASDVLSLERGVISLSVPKLSPGQQLSIATRQALVTVVGTRFWVAVLPSTPAPTGDRSERTCVGVSEGEIRITTRDAVQSLKANGRWSSDGLPCSDPADATNHPQATSSQEPTASPVPALGHAPRELRSPLPGPTSSGDIDRQRPEAGPTTAAGPVGSHAPPTAAFEDSSLEEQNQLFAAAVAARHAAQPARAIEILSALLNRYPDSPLATAAVRELEKARRETDTPEPIPSGP